MGVAMAIRRGWSAAGIWLLLAACTALASRVQKDQVSGPPLFSTFRKPVTSPSAASENSSAASGRDGKAWDNKAWDGKACDGKACNGKARLASCSAFAVALLLLGAMLWTLFEKNLVDTVTQQGWSRQLYAISAALEVLRR